MDRYGDYAFFSNVENLGCYSIKQTENMAYLTHNLTEYFSTQFILIPSEPNIYGERGLGRHFKF
jgi:hypothetical protein